MSSMSVAPASTARVTTSDGVGLAMDLWDVPAAGNDVTVLLLHGGGQTRHSWKSAGRLLAARGCRTAALDLRGHGDSDWAPDGDYRIGRFAQDVVEVATGLSDRVVLVGASLGGLTSLLASEALGDRVAALVLVDVTPRIEPAGVARIRGFMERTVNGFASLDDAAAAIGEYLSHRSRPEVTEGLAKNLRERPDGTWRWHWDPAFITNSDPQLGMPEVAVNRAAARLTAPALLVRGLLSDIVSDESVAALRALIPALHYTVIDGAAHTAAGDDNDAFVSAVVDFLTTTGLVARES